MDRIRFLGVLDVLALHEDAMRMSGEDRAPVARRELLESALAQVKQAAWYTEASPAELTVYLTTRLALAHAWVDGDKRTAAYAGLQFASRNGARDPMPDELISFADLLLKFIGANHERRDDAFAELHRFVETWFT